MSRIVDPSGNAAEAGLSDREVVEGKDFTISEWNGYANYECSHCQFATLYKDKLDEHFAYETYHQHKWAHPVPASEQESKVQKDDKGRKIATY